MNRVKIAFVIHDLGQGGAEKVLVNLVNNMNQEKFDITVISLFGGGVNEQFLKKAVQYKVWCRYMFPGNSHVMKLFTPGQLYRMCIKDNYDIVISYLEGPSARVVSGCDDPNAKLVTWIHCNLLTKKEAALSFRSMKEAKKCYDNFNQIICVSEIVKKKFCEWFSLEEMTKVLYNTMESEEIIAKSQEIVTEVFDENEINVIGVGSLAPVKGFNRLIPIIKRLREQDLPVHLYILGKGQDKDMLEQLSLQLGISEYVTFLGYQTNPYKFVKNSDLYICSSLSEGFSTAATEALIVGTPVCTVEVSGMREMLGENNEYGVVTQNNDEALYQGIYELLTQPDRLQYYKEKALERGKYFRKEKSVKAVEEMLMAL